MQTLPSPQPAPLPLSQRSGWKAFLRQPPPGSHILQIYEDVSREIEVASLFATEGLRKGERVFCVGSEPELGAIHRRVGEEWDGQNGSSGSGELTLLNDLDLNGHAPGQPTSRNALDDFTRDVFKGVPDRFSGVRWWGTRIARLFEEGLFEPCMAFEEHCHRRRATLPWSLLCAYNARRLVSDQHATAFWDVLRTHTHLIPAGDPQIALELFPEGVPE